MNNSNKAAYPLNGQKWQNEIGHGVGANEYIGLTKREYFAAMALQGILAHSINYMAADPIDAAKDAVKCADELLSALEKS